MIGFFFWTLWRKRPTFLFGAARVFAYAVVISLVAGLVCARAARADTAEAARGLGRDLLALSDVLADGKTLFINGERIHVASSVVPGEPKAVLDRFADHCEQNPSVLAKDLGSANGVLLRSSGDDEGVVLCIVASESSSVDLPTAIERFAKSKDLGDIGKMRYVYAKRTGANTHVLTAWTDDHFSFKSLAPDASGDAAGTDSALVPRPEGARRLLSAEVAGTSYAVRVYSAPSAPGTIIASYDVAMKGRGFLPIHDTKPSNQRAYVRNGLVVTMVAQAAEGGGTTLSFAELGASDAR